MKKLLTAVLGLAAALVLSSCFEYETEITVNKDGSGTIVEETVFGEQIVGMLEMAAAQGGGGAGQNPLADLKDEEKAKKKAEAYGEGVSLVKIEEVNKNGGKGVRVTYKFTDINKVSFNPSGALADMGEMAPGAKTVEKAKEENAKFKFADGKLTIILPQGEGEGEEAAADSDADFDPNNPETAMALEMMKGMKMSAKVTAAPGIAETNATHREGNTVTLFEMEFDKILKNPEGMKSLQKLDMKDRAKAAEALTKVDGATVETKKEVTITIK